MLLFAACSYWALKQQFEPTFEALEVDAFETDFARVENAIAHELKRLSLLTIDWAQWDDTYHYVTGGYPGFVKANLDQDTFANLGLNLVMFIDNDGLSTWGMLNGEYRRDRDLLVEIGLPEELRTIALQHHSVSSDIAGIVQTDLGLLAVSIRPIVTNDKQSPVGGTLVFGDLLDDPHLQTLRQRTEVEFELLSSADPNVSQLLSRTDRANGRGPNTVEVTDDQRIGYSTIVDIGGDPVALIRVKKTRSLEQLGRRTTTAALLSLAAVFIPTSLVIIGMMQLIVVRPLSELNHHMTAMRAGGDRGARSNNTSSDEIGTLARNFDDLVLELETARHTLLEQSFKSGMAEMAAGVLHNIRNAMTPLVNRLASATQTLRNNTDVNLSRAITEIRASDCDDERREKLHAYIALSLDDQDRIRSEMCEDLRLAAVQASHVESILADQESISHAKPVIEPIRLQTALTEAACVIPDNGRADTVLIDDSLNNLTVKAHRVGLMQILGNILLNAYESIQRNNAKTGRISVSAGPFEEDKRLIRISVADNGAGISAEFLQRIFERGFTAKTNGRGGLGLHWCANALAGMGGKIIAESDGEGLGACFHLYLPAFPLQDGQHAQ